MLYSDWLLIARTLEKTKHDDCRCYDCDTIDALLGDIAHYWDLNERELVEAMRWRWTYRRKRMRHSHPVSKRLFVSAQRETAALHRTNPTVVEDVSQPAPEPYSPGDPVRIYLDPADPDAHTHGTVCEITDLPKDDLDTEMGWSTDAYSYRLRDLEIEDELPLAFRHQEFVPTEDTQ